MKQSIKSSLALVMSMFSAVVHGQQSLSEKDLRQCIKTENLAQPVFGSSKGWLFYPGEFYIPSPLSDKTRNKYLPRLLKAFNDNKITPIIVIVPVRNQLYPEYSIINFDHLKFPFDSQKSISLYLEYQDQLKKIGFPTVNLYHSLSSDRNTLYYYKMDSHWNTQGVQVAAKSVSQMIKTFPGFDQTSPVTVTTELRAKKTESSYQTSYNALCGENLPGEPVDDYFTSAEQDLLGETSEDFVLVGTSNSKRGEPNGSLTDLNFRGFISQNLSRDVINYAFPGGGMWYPILNYFLNTENKPRFVIWEFPFYQAEFNNTGFFRQLIPSVYGKCKPEKQVGIFNIKQSNTNEITLPVEKYQQDTYLGINFNSPSVNKVKSAIEYESGKTIEVSFDRSNRTAFSNLTYLDLSLENDKIKKVVLKSTEKINWDFEAVMCRY